jgi:hypothetical protein
LYRTSFLRRFQYNTLRLFQQLCSANSLSSVKYPNLSRTHETTQNSINFKCDNLTHYVFLTMMCKCIISYENSFHS